MLLIFKINFFSEHPEIPQGVGKIKTLNKFDAAFFSVHAKQAHSMDPMSRILLEKTYEAIVDSGEKKNYVFVTFDISP